MESNQRLRVIEVGRNNKRKERDIPGSDPVAYTCIDQINIGQKDGDIVRVVQTHPGKEVL